MRALLLAVFVLALAAPAGAQTPPPNTTDPSITDGSAQRKLDRARERWRKARLHNYRFQLKRQCFCPPTSWVLFVRGGAPVRAPAEAGKVATVRRLHRRIQDAINERVHALVVRYGKRGMPRFMYIDGQQLVADDEIGYQVEHFWRGTRGRGGPNRPGEQ